MVPADWELAILTSFSAWRQLRESNGGTVILNADEQTLTITAPDPDEAKPRRVQRDICGEA